MKESGALPMQRRLLVFSLCLMLALSACGKPTADPPPQPEHSIPPVTAAPTPTPEPTPTPYSGPVNPLTGLPIDEAYVNRRPVAIMLNNLKKALPQVGVSQADIIYECLAEGGITRMLGLYQDPSQAGAIGSIRSSRTYYLELALGHDAVYIHAGGSPDAYNKIKAWNVTALDGVNGPYCGTSPNTNLMWRDSDRRKNMGYEHSVITTGGTIVQQFASYSFRKDHEEGWHYDMDFAQDGTPAGGVTANTVTVPFSNVKTGVFTYDPEQGLYLVEEYGQPYVDGNTGEQVGVTNVLVLKTKCAVIPGDSYGRITVDLTSGGDGYFACGGQCIDIRWRKDSRTDQFHYTTPDGSPITLGQGRSYVSIVPLDCQVEIQ